MLGEQVARQAGQALVADVCARAKANGCNLLEQPKDKLVTYVKVHTCLVALTSVLTSCRAVGMYISPVPGPYLCAFTACATHISQHTTLSGRLGSKHLRAHLSTQHAHALPSPSSLLPPPPPQAAFSRAHDASLQVYDDPPNAITYPCGNM